MKNTFHRGFVYADARVDDARLVVFNAISAREKGADIRTHTKLIAGHRENGSWRVALREADGEVREVRARALVNAAGPWVKDVQDELSAEPTRALVRHVKGSHIVVPRVHHEEHAYILQNSDNRIIFVIPYQAEFSLFGPTDRRSRTCARSPARTWPNPSLPRMSSGPTAVSVRCTTTAPPTPPQ